MESLRADPERLPATASDCHHAEVDGFYPFTSTQAIRRSRRLWVVPRFDRLPSRHRLARSLHALVLDRGRIDEHSRAVDAHILAQIAATTPTSGGTNAELIVSILLAAEVVNAAGYSPNTVVFESGSLVGSQDSGSAGFRRLRRRRNRLDARRVAEGVGRWIDHASRTRLAGERRVPHDGGARFATFEENDGSTNSSTVRL